MEEFNINIVNLLFVLIAAWAGGTIARRVGFPAILGELIIGILLGPGILGLLDYTETVKVIAEVGIILLMVYIGMEIDFSDLKKASWPGLLAASGGFIVPFVLGYMSIIWFGGTPMSALFVAIAVGVTSLATKSRILVDLKLLNTRIAYVLMAGALISDTLALLIFAGITSFADAGSVNMHELALVGGKALIFFALTISIGIYGLPWLGKILSRSKFKNSTFYFTIILIITFGYSEMAELAGMHNILGAFMAGLFMKDNLFPKNIFKEVYKTFYDVSIGFMAPIFFVTAGFFVSLEVFQTDLLMLIVVILLAIIGKIVGTALFYLPSGHGWREGITVGAGMNGRGAVEVIIAGIGLELGIIDNKIFSILVFMAIFTTMTVPLLLKWTTTWLRRRGELVEMSQRKGIIVLGVNPISLILAKHLQEKSPVMMIDTNRDSVKTARNAGFKCIHGNALNNDVMAEANPETISTFISLTSNPEVNMLAAQLARENFLIPNTLVTIPWHEKSTGVNLLETIKAVSLFAMRVHLDEWNHKISSHQFTEMVEKPNKRMETREWVKNKKASNADMLPLLIESAEGHKRPFHFGDFIEEDETVIYVK
ncbi:MAG: sodium:proton exchanger [Bacteroidetes bacterium]|jgi:Kef-type K+ transport system membrane component KefB/Trk K+ transport system NAD-binding subunit|nr:sodium:proton exchanger [Bacteroidota bacterium]